MASLVTRPHSFCPHRLSSSSIYAQRQLSSACNFRQSVPDHKAAARKLVLVENHSQVLDIGARIQNVNREFLSDKLGTDVDSYWSWTHMRRNFFLLQLKSAGDVNSLQNKCGFNLHSFPVKSRMIETTFEWPDTKSTAEASSGPHFDFAASRQSQMMTANEMRQKYSSVQLIEHITGNNTLSEFDTKLRYFLITQFEDMLCKGIFAGFHVYPFGSSLAGLGDSTSDLDIALLHPNLPKQKSLNFSTPQVMSQRDQNQQSLSLMSDMIRHFMPNISQVHRILRARVPIVKMCFDLAPIDIDISIELNEETGHHGFIMANFLAYCSNSDPVVKQFFLFLKAWAKYQGLVKSLPGVWFSNFQLISLAIYFLQTKNILHSMSTFESAPPKEIPQLNIFKLLYEFFEFLICFDFTKEAISILDAKSFTKPDYAPLYMENPIERELNICKNLNGVEFKKMLLLAYNSLDAMCNENFHSADLLDVDYFKQLEKQSKSSS